MCLQETKVQNEEFPSRLFEDAGYHPVFHGQKSYNGVAVLCAGKPDSVSFGFNDGKGTEEARLIHVKKGSLNLVNTYVPQGREPGSRHFSYKMEWFWRLLDYFKRNVAARESLLWCGDFNAAPTADDVHDPVRLEGHVCFCEPVRRVMETFRQWGMEDVFRRHHQGPGYYSFFDYRRKDSVLKNRGWRIDHVWATSALAQKSVKAWIDLEPRMEKRPSDHTVVAVQFDM